MECLFLLLILLKDLEVWIWKNCDIIKMCEKLCSVVYTKEHCNYKAGVFFLFLFLLVYSYMHQIFEVLMIVYPVNVA